MSDDSVKRPLRIIPVEVPLQAPPPFVQRQVERFQRALMPVRAPVVDRPARRAVPSATAPETPATPAEPAASTDDGATRTGATSGPGGHVVSVATAGTSRPRPPIVTVPIESRPTELPEAPAQAERQPPGGLAVDPDEGGTGGWDDSLVRMIQKLVRGTDPAMEAWTVTVPLDSDVLPDSALELALSRHRLALRFVTQSVVAHRLLSSHRGALAAKLQRGLNRSREIDIEVN